MKFEVGPVGYDVVLIDEHFPTFWRAVVPSSLAVKRPMKN